MPDNTTIKKCIIEYTGSNKTSITSVIAKTILAAFLACNGLLNDLITSLIPSMIISPLGSLLLDTTIFSISKQTFKNSNMKNSIGTKSIYDMIFLFIFTIFITIAIGVIYGYIYVLKHAKDFPTETMVGAQDKNHIYETIIIVSLCTITLPLAYKRKDVATLISIGIATALLPPLANIGITIGTYMAKPEFYKNYMQKKKIDNPIMESFKYSSIIFGINSIALIIASYLYINFECSIVTHKDLDIFYM